MTKYIPVITRGYSRKVPVDDIMYLEQRQRKLAIVTGEETYLSYQRREKMEQLEMRLIETKSTLSETRITSYAKRTKQSNYVTTTL